MALIDSHCNSEPDEKYRTLNQCVISESFHTHINTQCFQPRGRKTKEKTGRQMNSRGEESGKGV